MLLLQTTVIWILEAKGAPDWSLAGRLGADLISLGGFIALSALV
jgi:hypothetical protein